jgi:hypothetical protein
MHEPTCPAIIMQDVEQKQADEAYRKKHGWK